MWVCVIRMHPCTCSQMSNLSIFSDHIQYSASKLTVDGHDVDALVSAHGTPTYIYSEQAAVDNFRAIKSAFAAHHNDFAIHYSLKANANATLAKALIAEGAGIDCVSAGECFKAIRFGCPPDRIVFAGVGKTEEEIEFAVGEGVQWFNVENALELSHINKACERLNKTVQVALRVNPHVEANTHPSIATGHSAAKFGMPLEIVNDLLGKAAAYPHLIMESIHLHIGSQLGDTKGTLQALKITLETLEKHTQIKSVNIGGGFPVSYDNSPMPDVAAFAEAVAPHVQGRHLMLEPGRRILAPAGFLVTKVLYRKDQDNQRILIVDASMTELMRPALYGAFHSIIPLLQADRADPTATYTIVGPVCESTDVLGKNISLPDAAAQPGAYLAIMTAGAYGFAMANNYNARPLPPQLVIQPSGVIVSTKRQTFADLVRDELDM